MPNDLQNQYRRSVDVNDETCHSSLGSEEVSPEPLTLGESKHHPATPKLQLDGFTIKWDPSGIEVPGTNSRYWYVKRWLRWYLLHRLTDPADDPWGKPGHTL